MFAKAIIAVLLGSSVASAQLHSLAVAAGLEYFGTTVDERYVNSDAQYRALLQDTAEFGQVVPENGQKWQSTGPQPGVFSYTQGDIVPNFAKQNGQILRCHTLTWHSQLPNWVATGTWTRETLTDVIETHIQNVVTHYKGQCAHWDVVNEAADDSGNWRNSVFYQVLGTDYLPISFIATRAADPDTKLYYNDYNLEYNGAKTTRTLEVVRIIQDAGAPIDGVGFQGHLIVGSVPSRSQLATTLRRFTALGVEVAYTEVDIRHSSLPPSAAALVTQGNNYAAVVGSCIDVDSCVGVTIWGFTDKYSWVPQTFSGQGDALLYDVNYNKKPAWTSVSSVLAAAATGTVPTTTAAPPVTTTPATTAAPTTLTTSSARPTTTATPGGPQQARWGQCGGLNWTGPTVCQSPYTCQKQNDWYSQCL
ncbi:endo-1,4-beta-xylanase Z [Plectosphaerella cucumerina]|uniref:Beta-xylanase n=1 Tax=Plectosphaerella cucumerina TaxID=40658 RepID=A0A8K0T876_9PEZI|nr:endo-1,4-beta-xylanase Z [Plectosphaerella cucumerina]